MKNVEDKKRADEISQELLDKPRYRPRLLDPENTVFVPRLDDRLDSVIDDPLFRYGKKFAKPFENVIRQGKRMVDPKLIRPKTSVQTTLPQHFPRLTTENPYDEEGRIKPGAIAPITAFKQMGKDAFNNLLSYGLIPGLTVDSLDWENSSNLREMTPIPVKSGASFVAPVGTLDAIRSTMNPSGGRGKPIYVGIRGFAQPEDKAFLRTDSREAIEAAALGRIPPGRLVLPFNVAQSGKKFGSPLSFEEWRDKTEKPKSFEEYVEQMRGPEYLQHLQNDGYTEEKEDYRQLWDKRQDTQRTDYEKYLQGMKNSSIRTNLLNQRLAELGEDFTPLTAENYPMEAAQHNPYRTLYDIEGQEQLFPKTVADVENRKVRQALGAVPKEWSQNTKFNLMNPALSDAEREAIRREFEENADHEIYMNSRHDGTIDPAKLNRITRGLMSAIYGPQASNMIDYRNNVGDAYSERGEKIGLEMNNPAAASLGLPNTWNAPQLFNPNFNPNQSVVKAPRITAYSPREIKDIAPDLQGIRYIPREYLESAGKPVRVHSGGKRGRGQSYDWEQDLQRLKYDLPQSSFASWMINKPKPLTGLFEEDKFVPKYNLAQRQMVMAPVESENVVAGQFMHPPVKEALREPDFTASRDRPMALTGILEQPQFMREATEGSKGLGEGFHYGELEPDSVVQLKLPYDIQPLEMARVAGMREYDSPKNQRDKEAMNWLSHIPSMSVPSSTEWWKQQGATEMTAPQLEQAGLFQAGEPMDIAMQLLKREMSPEARQHKLEYDKKYESTPERVKYREELNRERRKRGIYGSGDHMDVSHTEGGKLTLEGEHENRARHFKERGTLRPSKIAIRKDN